MFLPIHDIDTLVAETDLSPEAIHDPEYDIYFLCSGCTDSIHPLTGAAPREVAGEFYCDPCYDSFVGYLK